MKPLVLNNEQTTQLDEASAPLKMYDVNGKLRGFFLTEEEYTRLLYNLANAEFAREEAEEAAKGIVRKWDGTNGKTTAEAIAYVKEMAAKLAGEK